jgi:hypothetical protein
MNREQATIPVSSSFLDSFQLNDADRNRLILKVLMVNISVIENLLMGYHYMAGGRVSDVIVIEESIQFYANLAGSFNISYQTYFSMACSDKGYSTTNVMVIDFEVDFAEPAIILQGEEIRERSHDEF